MGLLQIEKQIQTVTPQMIQSMNILQMNAQELQEYLQEELQENPVLELPELEGETPEIKKALRELEWLSANDRQNSVYYSQDAENDDDPLARLSYSMDDKDLPRYILSQFQETDLEPDIMRCVSFLVGCLDSNGWLDEDLPRLAKVAGVSLAQMERALVELQAAEPAGVGARGLSECLSLQIGRYAGDHTLALAIVRDHLDDVAKRRYDQIARQLHTGTDAVTRTCERIRKLDPKPGGNFAARENLTYIIPDVMVAQLADRLEVMVNTRLFPHLAISSYYADLLRNSGDEEVRAYLSEKVLRAKNLIKNVDQRQSTLTSCAQFIARQQELFFRRGRGYLRPMGMAEAADSIGVHLSTVSRAIKGKYLQCSQGVYPLSYFFSRSLGPAWNGATAEQAKAMLRELIDDETQPLSDQKLCEQMRAAGCELSRRTVAKYREELGYANASVRKRPQ